MAKLLRKYPNAARVLALRAETYNRQLEQAHALAQAGKVLLVAPDDIGGDVHPHQGPGGHSHHVPQGAGDAKAIRGLPSWEMRTKPPAGLASPGR